MKLVSCLMAAFAVLALSACLPTNRQSLVSEGATEPQTYTLSLLQQMPVQVTAFFKTIAGEPGFTNNPCKDRETDNDGYYTVFEKIHCLPDYYFSSVLPAALPREFTMTRDVTMSYERPRGTGGRAGGQKVTVRHTWRGVKINNRMVMFRQKNFFLGQAALDGNWWVPLRVCPTSILENHSLEEKMRHCLDALIYDSIRNRRVNEKIDSLEAAISFVPIVGSYNELRYHNGGARAVCWLIGDIASLGLASKVKAFSATASVVVLATVPVRIGVSVSNAVQGEAGFVDLADGVLATVEGSFAIMRFAKLRQLSSVAGASSLAPLDSESASKVSELLGRSPEEILRSGVTREEAQRLGITAEILEDVYKPKAAPVTDALPGGAGAAAGRVISPEQMHAISNYTNTGYEGINGYLRTNSVPYGFQQEALDAQIKLIDDAIATSPKLDTLPALYRGVDDEAPRFLQSAVGDIIPEPAYMSTTLSKKTADEFTNGVGAVLIIENPGAARGVTANNAYESSEYILQRGLNMQVIEVITDPQAIKALGFAYADRVLKVRLQ